VPRANLVALFADSVPADSQIAPVALSLMATCAWGLSDFLGGFASRRANAFLLTTITHISGTAFMVILALAFHSPLPLRDSLLWAMAAGVLAGASLAIFYRALAAGNMGLTAPIGAVLGAGIPTIVDMMVEGKPGLVRIAGFVTAGIGIWLISRTEGAEGRPHGLGMAVLAGVGFAGYFLCVRQAGNGSVFWIAGVSRATSFVTTAIMVVVTRQYRPMDRSGVAWGVITGLLDISGSAFFIRASQAGRLDTAVVISSLYPAITVLLARMVLREHFSRWKVAGMLAALIAVPLIAG
jgi:drug/metabolite transporter (DMT)-like permease